MDIIRKIKIKIDLSIPLSIASYETYASCLWVKIFGFCVYKDVVQFNFEILLTIIHNVKWIQGWK